MPGLGKADRCEQTETDSHKWTAGWLAKQSQASQGSVPVRTAVKLMITEN